MGKHLQEIQGGGTMKLLPLSQGRSAKIDDDQYEKFGKLKWSYSHGYAKRTDSKTKRSIYLHRLITNAGPGTEVDHINGDTLDNTLSNLRVCKRAENRRNQKPRRDSKHGFKGIRFSYAHGNRFKPYQAQIRVNGIYYRSKYFATAREAAIAYDELALKHHGNFARLNANVTRQAIQ
jgi:hypothetical protein